MAGTEAKKIAPATNNRGQKGAARLTGRRSLPRSGAFSLPAHHAGITGCWQATPAARWRLFYLMELTLSPDDKRQSSHWLSVSCRPHKFPVNLTLKGWFRQGTLGRLKRNFLIRPGAPRTSAAIAAPAPPKSTVLLEIGCGRADRGRTPQ